MKGETLGDIPELTTRQSEIVKLMTMGYTTCESIGVQLGISPNTVRAHRAEIYERLGVNSSLQMILKLYHLTEKEKASV